jgi:hypothetical protein
MNPGRFNSSLEVTVSVRWIPLVPAAYGTRVARLVRTNVLTMPEAPVEQPG